MIFAAVRDLARPPALSTSASRTEFSLQRALADLKVIAAEPHPVGSAEDGRVRNYIVEQLKSIGLEPQTQRVSAVASIVKYGPPYFTLGRPLIRIEALRELRGVLTAWQTTTPCDKASLRQSPLEVVHETLSRLDSRFAHDDGLPCRRTGTTAQTVGAMQALALNTGEGGF